MAKAFFYQILLTEKVTINGSDVIDSLCRGVDLRQNIRRQVIEERRIRLSDDNVKWPMLDVLRLLDDRYEETQDIENAAILFGLIGNKSTARTSKRNQKTLERQDIKKTSDEHLETGTFFCLFFDLNLIIYITAMGAP